MMCQATLAGPPKHELPAVCGMQRCPAVRKQLHRNAL
ncbi:hypothetical protein E2C01_026763 [Portunus trituberculatus]|uniref:Uncharacterized protein n=1 Tax=Portunus trituberculatus TaxID=210409 RepID=A0A5B7ELW6_PORTR|nr:hypothetical protein [Portunus trituberculatus]